MTIHQGSDTFIPSIESFNPSPSGTGGFVSYYSLRTQDCVARWVVADAILMVRTGRTDELTRAPSDELAEDSESARYLDIEVLNSLELRLDRFNKPCYLTIQEGRGLAQLAVALLNYDARHIADDTLVLYVAEERQKLLRMITVVAVELVEPELLGRVLPIDPIRLEVKSKQAKERVVQKIIDAFHAQSQSA